MDLYRMAGHLIRRLNQKSTQAFQKRMKEEGWELTPVQFAALEALSVNPNIDQARVAALIGYDRATIGGVIDRLDHKGYITRIVSPKDRRARVLSLSNEGAAVLRSVKPIVKDLQLNILSGLDQKEQALFLSLAQKAVDTD